MAEEEIFVKHNHAVSCREESGVFNCYSYVTTWQKNIENLARAGGVFVENGRLVSGFNETVIVLKKDVLSNTEKRENNEIVSGGQIKNLYIRNDSGAGYSGNGPCYLSLLLDINGDDEWNVNCISGISEKFRFVDKNVNSKYRDLREKVYKENVKYTDLKRNAYLFSICLPVVALLFCFFMLKIIYRLFTYIRYGAKKS